jgi:hypothetical protein
MTIPAHFPIALYQGDSFKLFFRVKVRDTEGVVDYQSLAGSTPKAQIRATADTTGTPMAEFTCTLANQTTTKGGCTIELSTSQTAGITAVSGVWDCEILYSDGEKKTFLAGPVTITKQVTR